MSTPCPDKGRLQKLLDSGLPPPEEREVVRHLDDCPGCQQALEGLATGEWSWAEPARGCGGARPPDRSAFWPALRSVEASVTVASTSKWFSRPRYFGSSAGLRKSRRSSAAAAWASS